MDRVVSSLLAELDGAGGVNFNFGGNRPGADQVAEMYVSGLSQIRGHTVCPHKTDTFLFYKKGLCDRRDEPARFSRPEFVKTGTVRHASLRGGGRVS